MSRPGWRDEVARPNLGPALALWESYLQNDVVTVRDTVTTLGIDETEASCLDLTLMMLLVMLGNSNDVLERLDMVLETTRPGGRYDHAGVCAFATGLRDALSAKWGNHFVEFANMDDASGLSFMFDLRDLTMWNRVDGAMNMVRAISTTVEPLASFDEAQRVDYLRGLNLRALQF